MTLVNGVPPDVRRMILAQAARTDGALLALTGITDTMTFYASSTSGGTCDVLNTLTIEAGRITEWLQTAPSGSGGGYQFDDADNSIYLAIW